MIRFFEEKDRWAVVSIWQEAFGDSEALVSEFLDLFGKYMLVVEFEKKVVSMATFFPVKANGKCGRYIYAVATDKNYRKMGFAGALLEYAKQGVKGCKEDFLVILPQNNELFGFYKKFGFSELKCVKYIDKTPLCNKKSEIIIEEISAKEYYDCRDAYFNGKGYVEWSMDMLRFFTRLYNGAYLKLTKMGKTVALLFCYAVGDEIFAPEVLTNDGAFKKIGKLLGKSTFSGIKACKNGESFAMIYPEEFSDCYFGIGMN